MRKQIAQPLERFDKGFQSPRYHTPAKGCKIINRSAKPTQNADYYCEVHRRRVCKCGWEWKWHYGTNSRKL